MASPQPEPSQSRSQGVPSVAESSGSPEKDAATIAEQDDEGERMKNREGVQLTEKDAIALEEEEDEWEHDSANPRTWTSRKKWRMTAIVRSALPDTLLLVLFHNVMYSRCLSTPSSRL